MSRRRKGGKDGKPKVKDLWIQLLESQKKMQDKLDAGEEIIEPEVLIAKQQTKVDTATTALEVAQAAQAKAEAGAAKEGLDDAAREAAKDAVVRATEDVEAAQRDVDDETKKLEKLKADEEANVMPFIRRGLESSILFVGARGSGKSSLISAFLAPSKAEEKPKSTVALEYTYGRRHNGPVKDVCHVWELGGGFRLAPLLQVPIAPARLGCTTVAVTLDLSKPADCLEVLTKWLELILGRVSSCALEMKRNGAMAKELDRVLDRAEQRFGADHPDLKQVKPCAVPIVVVLSKFDVFLDLESAKRKQLVHAIRFVAHAHGAAVVSVSRSDKKTLADWRTVLNHHIFNAPMKKARQCNTSDANKPLTIAAGRDTLESIGIPPGTNHSAFDNASLEVKIQKWKHALREMFGEPEVDVNEAAHDEEESEAFLEGAVDKARKQKRDELLQYRKEAERKARLEGEQSKKKKKPKKEKAKRKTKESKD